MRRVHLVPAAAVALAMSLSACTTVPQDWKEAEAYECPPAECDPPQPQGPGGALVVEGGEFFFEILEGEDSVQEGSVGVTFNNVGGAEHNFTIDEAFGDVSSVPPDGNTPAGETDEATLELFAGTWTYYCSVPGHRSAGMEGTITVAPGTGAGLAPDAGPTGTGTEGGNGQDTEDVQQEGEPAGEETPPATPQPSPTATG